MGDEYDTGFIDVLTILHHLPPGKTPVVMRVG